MHTLLGADALVAAIAINAPASAVDDATALGAIELEAHRASCASLLASVMEATGKTLGRSEALNQITECANQAQARCDALPRTDGFCKGLREGFHYHLRRPQTVGLGGPSVGSIQFR